MCTAISFTDKKHYFGRNLDLEGSFGEGVVYTPRGYAWKFRAEKTPSSRFAMIGMGFVRDGVPLYYDAVNECGLAVAGLNFPKSAVYLEEKKGMRNLAPFELIPYLLLSCKDLAEARALLETVNLIRLPFGDGLPVTPLHWMISDKTGSLVAEPTAEGLKVYENPVNVLTNNPPFPMQLQRLNDYLNLTPYEPQPKFSKNSPLSPYSRGMGALGLPGDLSSASRFARAAFTLSNLVCGDSEEERINGFFHVLSSVAMTRGAVRLKEDLFEQTVYSSCCNTDDGIYYYTTYENSAVSAVDMRRENAEAQQPVFYPIEHTPRILFRKP